MGFPCMGSAELSFPPAQSRHLPCTVLLAGCSAYERAPFAGFLAGGRYLGARLTKPPHESADEKRRETVLLSDSCVQKSMSHGVSLSVPWTGPAPHVPSLTGRRRRAWGGLCGAEHYHACSPYASPVLRYRPRSVPLKAELAHPSLALH
jgi:hypothetical protein